LRKSLNLKHYLQALEGRINVEMVNPNFDEIFLGNNDKIAELINQYFS
jgi:hypothetical protein